MKRNTQPMTRGEFLLRKLVFAADLTALTLKPADRDQHRVFTCLNKTTADAKAFLGEQDQELRFE